MLSESSFVSIRFADEFEENLYRLSKRFRNIRKDIVSVIEQIQVGNFVGDSAEILNILASISGDDE